jgi:hypothetical protein
MMASIVPSRGEVLVVEAAATTRSPTRTVIMSASTRVGSGTRRGCGEVSADLAAPRSAHRSRVAQTLGYATVSRHVASIVSRVTRVTAVRVSVAQAILSRWLA